MFAGAGGFRTGLANAGDIFMPVGWCEIDKYAQRAYRALYETDGEYFCEDARAIRTDEVPEIDLICAGFPCQPFSVSGRRLGFADTRGTLFHEIVRVAEARRPAYLLLENVPGLLSHENGDGEVWHLDVGSSHPGAVFGPKGLAVRQLKRHASWVQNVPSDCKIF